MLTPSAAGAPRDRPALRRPRGRLRAEPGCVRLGAIARGGRPARRPGAYSERGSTSHPVLHPWATAALRRRTARAAVAPGGLARWAHGGAGSDTACSQHPVWRGRPGATGCARRSPSTRRADGRVPVPARAGDRGAADPRPHGATTVRATGASRPALRLHPTWSSPACPRGLGGELRGAPRLYSTTAACHGASRRRAFAGGSATARGRRLRRARRGEPFVVSGAVASREVAFREGTTSRRCSPPRAELQLLQPRPTRRSSE